jgi:hypothetical protein
MVNRRVKASLRLMTEPRQSQHLNATRVSRHPNAPRARVYNALIDPDAIVKWKEPSDMTFHRCTNSQAAQVGLPSTLRLFSSKTCPC